MKTLRLPERLSIASFDSVGGSCLRRLLSLVADGRHALNAWTLFSRFRPCFRLFLSAAPFGISRVSVETFADMPCSQIPAESPRPASPGVLMLPSRIFKGRASTMRSFRGSIARPPGLLCTLRAAIADDDATLAYRLVANLYRAVIPDGWSHTVNFVAL